MRIAILGTRGIPNNYGGFEQFAEFLSTGLVEHGFDITVYNPHFHAYHEDIYKGVKIVRVYCPESVIGGWANFIYDFLSLWHAYQKRFDIIYELGYGSSAVSYVLLHVFKPNKTKLLTNMDGLEWKRAKWNSLIKWFTKRSERLALKFSDYAISDNIGIQNYYLKEYGKVTDYLPYGADVVNVFDEQNLNKYNVTPFKYFLVIARLEPENNIELIIQSYLESNQKDPLLIVGGVGHYYGQFLKAKYKLNSNVHFLGGIYNKVIIDNLRHFAKLYLHGHSVGGTNPSLLEAMACSTFVVAHNNEFNVSVLGLDGLYFSDKIELTNIFNNSELPVDTRLRVVQSNLQKINEHYNWSKIVLDYSLFFKKSMNSAE